MADVTIDEGSLDTDGGVRLVYVKSVPGDDSVEPLVAVVASEAEALTIYHELTAALPETYTSWEHHRLQGYEIGGTPPAEVYLVLSGWVEDQMPDGQREMTDPVGEAAFVDRGEAERLAARLDAAEGRDYVMWSRRLGERRQGWPFSAT